MVERKIWLLYFHCVFHEGWKSTLAYTMHTRMASAKPHGRITDKMDHSSGCMYFYTFPYFSISILFGLTRSRINLGKSSKQHQTSPLLSTPSLTNGLLLLDFYSFNSKYFFFCSRGEKAVFVPKVKLYSFQETDSTLTIIYKKVSGI